MLFRADTDKDIIRFLAEQLSKPGEYEKVRNIADRWKGVLRTIGRNPHEIQQALEKEGLARTTQAIRSWLTNPDIIGPAREDEDLRIIARAARDQKFEKQIPQVSAAITATRGAHGAAGFRLSELLVRELPKQIPKLSEAETVVELSLDRFLWERLQ